MAQKDFQSKFIFSRLVHNIQCSPILPVAIQLLYNSDRYYYYFIQSHFNAVQDCKIALEFMQKLSMQCS